MRISDWSSDVCSSDLAVELEVLGHLGGQLARRRDDERARHARAGSAARQDVDHGQSEAGGLAGAGLGAAEIGRASCRDRVCQYVSITVVAVSIKKKKMYTD